MALNSDHIPNNFPPQDNFCFCSLNFTVTVVVHLVYLRSTPFLYVLRSIIDHVRVRRSYTMINGIVCAWQFVGVCA